MIPNTDDTPQDWKMNRICPVYHADTRLPKPRKLLPAFDRTLFSRRDYLPGRVRRFLSAARNRIRGVLAR